MHADVAEGTGAPSATAPPAPVRRLTPAGRTVRVLAALAGIALLLAGTLFGQDDHFPFGPFRMYATTDKLNDPVKDTRLQAVDAAGRRFLPTDNETGFRRAELEGQTGRFKADPALLSGVAAAYAERNPGRPKLVEVDVVIRWLQLKDGRPTGKFTSQTVATWHAADGGR